MVIRRKFLRTVALCFLMPGLALFIYSGFITNRYLYSLPQVRDELSGNIYPDNIHGIVVYETAQERNRLRLFDKGGIAVFFLGLALGGFSQKLKE